MPRQARGRARFRVSPSLSEAAPTVHANHFAAARVIVAPHGAALTNLVFCRPGVRVLELFAPGYTVHCYWTITANIPDARYRYLVARTPERTGDNELMQDIDLAPEEIEAALDELLAS